MKNQRAFEIVILTIIAVGVIFYKFNNIPHNLDYDEVDFAKLAISLDRADYVPFSPLATGHPTLYFYIILLSFKLFGISNFALRLPSAVFGVFNVIIFYLIFRYINKKYAFITTCIFATLRWHFAFARFSYEATFLLLLELLAIYFLFRFLVKQKVSDVLLLSFFSGLAFNSYAPGRIFFVSPLVFLTILTIRQQLKKRNGMILALVLFFLTIFPLFSYLLTHQDQRFDTQFFFKNPHYSMNQKMKFFKDGIVSTALMFHFRGDFNGRHNYPRKPAINPLLGLFFVIGFVVAVMRYKNIYNQFFLIYFFTSILPTLLSYPHENPHMLRTIGAIPSVIYFALKGFDWSISQIPQLPYRKCMTTVIIIYIVFLSAFAELKTYFIYQRIVAIDAFAVSEDIKKIIKTDVSRP